MNVDTDNIFLRLCKREEEWQLLRPDRYIVPSQAEARKLFWHVPSKSKKGEKRSRCGRTHPPPPLVACEFTQKLAKRMDATRTAKDARHSSRSVGLAPPEAGEVPSATPTPQGSSPTALSDAGAGGASMLQPKETAAEGAAAE